jgi:exodeoxyribonuclease VII large subunit
VAPDRIGLPFDEPGPPVEVPRPEIPPARRVLTVSELTAGIRALLENTFGEVWVEGELSNCRLWNTGHLYFTLKDAGAQVKGVMFRSAVRRVKFKPEDGLQVIARGRIGVYEPKGEYQIVCEHLEPHGLGALQLAFEQLKRRLQAEGLFDPARKRPLPALPRKIGIVTSIDGAALRDIIKVLARRYPNLHLVIRPSRVQGEGAAADIAAGISAVGTVPGVEVIIVGRGGGAMEDLWAFNEEEVARAIVASRVPVISAVGHEVDVTIADFAADVRAPTPSAAAEMVVARKDEFTAHLDRLSDRARAAELAQIERLRAQADRLAARPALAGWPARVAMMRRDVAELTHDLRRTARAHVARQERRYHELRLRLETVDLRRRLSGVRTSLFRADAGIKAAAVRMLHEADSRFRATAARLESLSPVAVLARGYAVCWNHTKTAIIRDLASVTVGEQVRVTLSRGELGCTVDEKTGT